MRWVVRSKIHQATVTEANVEYVGSLAVDRDLINKAGFWLGEKVLVASLTSGQRLETYIIPAEQGSGTVCMNGAAAHLIKPGEKVIIMGFELTEKPLQPAVILVDDNNKFERYL